MCVATLGRAKTSSWDVTVPGSIRDASNAPGRGLALDSNDFIHPPVTGDDEAQLAARPVREDAPPHAMRVELIAGKVAVDELDDLVRRHASSRVAPLGSEAVFLLLAPAVDVLDVVGVDVDEGVKEVREMVVASEEPVEEKQVLQAVLLQGATRGAPFPLDVTGVQGPESDEPALEDDDLDGRLAGLVDGLPLRLGPAVPPAVEGALVVLGNSRRLALRQRGKDASRESDVVGSWPSQRRPAYPRAPREGGRASPGSPRCCTRALSGCSRARATWFSCVR